MRNFITILVVNLLLMSCAMAQNTGAIHLANSGQSEYVIALASDAIPAERTAAGQLQQYLQEITGANFPIQSEADVKMDAPQILIGAGDRVKVLLPPQDLQKLGDDGIVIKTVGNKLILAGDRPRGTLYAVFQFLEDVAGCRWWTPTESHIPRKSTFIVPVQNILYTPPFRYREHFTTAVRENPIFATMMRENGHYQTQNPEWGGHYNMLGFVHTFSKLLPLETYFKDHPEWYSDPDNDFLPCTATSKMPPPQKTDPDLSNPQVLEEVTKNALAWIAENPDAGYISISQNDNRDSYCRCAECAALIAAEGSPSAPVVKFVNQVAERIHQKHPDFLVETLAYYYSAVPPKTLRPAKNVVIRMAPIKSDYGHPLESKWNNDTREQISAWSKISSQLFLWNYVTNFSGNMLPHPNWDGLAKDLRFFAENKVTGVFEQGDAYTNGVGDFVQLRAWLMAKLMWNPHLDQDKLVDEFLQGYYGAAAPYLRQYLDLTQKAFLSQQRALSTFNTDLFFFSLPVMNESMALFDQAEHATQGQKVLLQRVQRTRLSLELARLYQFKSLQREAQFAGKQLLGNPDPRQSMEQLIESAKHFGMRNFREGVTFDSEVPQLRSMNAPQAELPQFAKEYPPRDIIDLQAGEFTLYGRGTTSNLETDDKAAGGVAASIIGTTNMWAIQAELDRFLPSTNKEKWHVYALARIDTEEGKTPKSAAFQCGLYDVVNRVRVSNTYVPIAKMNGEEYQRVDLGVQELSGGMYIYFAPLNDAAIKKVYVNRIILIRAN